MRECKEANVEPVVWRTRASSCEADRCWLPADSRSAGESRVTFEPLRCMPLPGGPMPPRPWCMPDRFWWLCTLCMLLRLLDDALRWFSSACNQNETQSTLEGSLS